MAWVRRLVLRGSNVTLSIPRELLRELALVHRNHVVIRRLDGRAFHVRALEVDDDEGVRRAARPAKRPSTP